MYYWHTLKSIPTTREPSWGSDLRVKCERITISVLLLELRCIRYRKIRAKLAYYSAVVPYTREIQVSF